MKTSKDFICEMEQSNTLMTNEFTFPEYAAQLIDFQNIICKIASGNAYHDGMRIDEALYIMESTARKKNMRSNPAVHSGILTMKRLEKEMAVTMSGIKGENLISKTLEYVNRPNTKIFRNVYITDGKDETELDAIVLTDSGIIVLEMKKVKSDLIFSTDGRLIRNGDECFDKIPLGEKMSVKRRLLKSYLEKVISDKGIDIPVNVDSLIIFSAPKGQFIRIDDKYRKEKFCFRTGLNAKIENYIGCVHYEDEQLTTLSEILSGMEANVKRFNTELDFNIIRRSLAEAFAVLQNDHSDQESPFISNYDTNIANQEKNRDKIKIERNKEKKASGISYIAAGFAGVMLVGASLFLGNVHRRI